MKKSGGKLQIWVKMDVIGVGALNYDRIYLVEKVAKLGTHEPILDVFESPGGSSANTIAALARLAHQTGFVGIVGDDIEANLILKDFGDWDVDVTHIRALRGRTGLILCFVDNTGERTMYPHPGVNNKLEFVDDDIAYCNLAKIVHLSSYVDQKQFEEQIRLVNGLTGPKISFAPGDLYARKGIQALTSILERTDILFVNESEQEVLTGAGLEDGVKILHDVGVGTIIVTLGELGSFISSGEIVETIKSESVDPVDSTGAGDAYAAGYLSGFLDGKDVKECAKIGNSLAAGCIKEFGARGGLQEKKK